MACEKGVGERVGGREGGEVREGSPVQCAPGEEKTHEMQADWQA